MLEEFKVLVPPALLGIFFQIFKPLVEKFISDHRWYPLIAVIIGIVANLIFAFWGGLVLELIIGGALAGLAGAGLYDFVKETILNK